MSINLRLWYWGCKVSETILLVFLSGILYIVPIELIIRLPSLVCHSFSPKSWCQYFKSCGVPSEISIRCNPVGEELVPVVNKQGILFSLRYYHQ